MFLSRGGGAHAVTWAWWTAADDELFICSPVAGEGPGAITQPGICTAILSRAHLGFRSEPGVRQGRFSSRFEQDVGCWRRSLGSRRTGDRGWNYCRLRSQGETWIELQGTPAFAHGTARVWFYISRIESTLSRTKRCLHFCLHIYNSIVQKTIA